MALDPGNFSAHEELARLAEQRDELELAAEHFTAAWRLRPDRRDLLLDLGRVWKEMGRDGDSIAALIAAWRGASARVSEQARVLKLGWAYNIVKDDQEALRWFDQARQSPDPAVSTQALRAYRNLVPGLERFRTTLWAYPIYSTRWHDAFGYAQIKTEARLAFLPLRPYVSLRLIGDFRGSVQTAFGPQFLSDRSAIAAAGLATIPWYGLPGWFETGEALFFRRTPQDRARMKPDYRGGVSYGKGFGHLLASGSHGLFAESNIDGVFVSRFSNDSLLYSQNRFGYTLRNTEGFGGFHLQALWNANLTADAQRQYWANFVESGPGFRFRFDSLPASPMVSISFLRGAYLMNDGNPRRPNYNELRVSVWYAIARLAHSSPPPSRAPRRRSLIASSVPIQVRGPRFFRRWA